jgi:EAL and modified HD-GYP domain-containing signal transduction protein
MNAPERLPAAIGRALGAVALCYAPLIDKHRKAIGNRLTLLSVDTQNKADLGTLLADLNEVWPEQGPPTLIAPLDTAIEDSVNGWQPPSNAILEIPGIQLSDPVLQAAVQILFRDGKKLALRGRTEAPLPPALLSCFEYAVIHISEDRRVNPDGTPSAAPAGVRRRMPFIMTGVRSVAEVETAFSRGAIASVGWPLDEALHRSAKPLQAGQATVLELLRLVRDDAPVAKIDQVLKRDPAIAFKLLRLVNSAAFGLTVQITSFQHAVMMLGYKKMTRWLSLLLATASKDANTFPLMHASIRRGLFLEALGAAADDGERRDELFITGAFSLLDRITGASFDQLFELISLADDVIEAIRNRQGPHACYLSLVESIERADPVGVIEKLEELAMPVAECNVALLQALGTADLLDADL